MWDSFPELEHPFGLRMAIIRSIDILSCQLRWSSSDSMPASDFVSGYILYVDGGIAALH